MVAKIRKQLWVILTGAGISAESGIGTFRDSGGLWERHRIEDVATPEAFLRAPGRVHDFYNARRAQLDDPAIAPNAAHWALARLEAALPDQVLLVTQNVDDLHERAGSRNLIHMHGALRRGFCRWCDHRFAVADTLSVDQPCGACQRSAGLRPDIVWFGEMPYEMDRIHAALARCTQFVSIGTSGHVYPAAGFVNVARDAGADTLELNLERSEIGNRFHHHIAGPASETVPAWVDRVLQSQ